MQARILAAWELAKGTSNLLGGRLWKKQQFKAIIGSFQQAKLTKHGLCLGKQFCCNLPCYFPCKYVVYMGVACNVLGRMIKQNTYA